MKATPSPLLLPALVNCMGQYGLSAGVTRRVNSVELVTGRGQTIRPDPVSAPAPPLRLHASLPVWPTPEAFHPYNFSLTAWNGVRTAVMLTASEHISQQPSCLGWMSGEARSSVPPVGALPSLTRPRVSRLPPPTTSPSNLAYVSSIGHPQCRAF